MKCPIPFVTLEVDSFPPDYERRDCLKEECAWWDVPVQRCLWQNVSEKLSFIYLELNSIAKELTLLRPPRK